MALKLYFVVTKSQRLNRVFLKDSSGNLNIQNSFEIKENGRRGKTERQDVDKSTCNLIKHFKAVQYVFLRCSFSQILKSFKVYVVGLTISFKI